MTYPRESTGLLLVDPYNDFLSEGGKLNGLAKQVADAVGTLDNLRRVVAAARKAGIQVFYVPHHRARPDDLKGWTHPSPYQLGAARAQVFAAGSWGGEWHPDFQPLEGDVLVHEHWGGSGFANTDLDFQLKQHGVQQVILVGMLANTCIESTGRFAAELGYHVTLVTDATAAFSAEAMHAAHELNGPTYAHAILNTEEVLAALTPNPSS
ncbi:isochorismatase [Metapseudomonas resinovorans]|uniref:isochorismatase family cysteine hydrolase n=1 Tax=Metapseudomonas resinovorans TaxID=53412 RepID=UPI000986E676|nr:isochorismatase family cysteine hydrolase [Pseudomonas resinovorans]GLZ85698.1 isochorismatase [Pseudomonas resinovorans]